MNINLIYPSIPSPLDRHIPGTTITACHILNTLAEQIKLQLKQSAKDTPSASIRIITAPIENLIRRITRQARTQVPSANLNIILQLGASAQDGRWHAASGFTVTSQPVSPQSDQLSDLLIRQDIDPNEIPIKPCPGPGDDHRPRFRSVVMDPECYHYDGVVYIYADCTVTYISATITRIGDNLTWTGSASTNTLSISASSAIGVYRLELILSDGRSYIGEYMIE